MRCATACDRLLARKQQEAKRREREAAEAERLAAAEAAAEAAALAASLAAEEAEVKPEPKIEPTSRQQSGEFPVPAPRQPKAANTGKGANCTT